MKILEFIQQPWPWWVTGPLITYIMFSLLYFGKGFGVSSNFKTMCTMMGADKVSDFFKVDWRDQTWNLLFILGVVIGGYIASNFLTPDPSVGISENTITVLQDLGISIPGSNYVPKDIFRFDQIYTIRGF